MSCHAYAKRGRPASNGGVLQNALIGRAIAIGLVLADNRQPSAARGECSAIRAEAEPLAELAILVCKRPFKVIMCGGTHGGTADEERVQTIGCQDGKEERVRESRGREAPRTGRMGVGVVHENLS